MAAPVAAHASWPASRRPYRLAGMFRTFALTVVFVAVGCTTSPSSTTVTCPTTNPPTYASFGQTFFATFCTPCHSASNVGSAARNGAPDGLNFDTEAEVAANAEDINMMAGVGPNGPNHTMPYMPGPVTTPPTDAQRTTLAQFLACEEQSSN